MTSRLNVQRFLEEAYSIASSREIQPVFRRLRPNLTLVLSVEYLPRFRTYPLFHLSIAHPVDWVVEHDWVIPMFVAELGEPENVQDVALPWSNGKVWRPGIIHHAFW